MPADHDVGRQEARGEDDLLHAEGGRPEAGSGPDDVVPLPAAEPAHPRIAALLEVILCSGLPSQALLHVVLALVGIHPYTAPGRLSAIYVFTISFADTLLLVALVAWFLRLHGESWRTVLLGARPLLAEAVHGVFLVPVVLLLAVTVMAAARVLVPSLHDVPTNPMEGLISSPAGALLFGLVAVVGGGVREEVQRAFILHRFERHLGGAWVGLVLFSLAFGAGHKLQGLDVAVTTAALGLFWGIVYLRRRSVASTVVSHAGFNSVEILRYVIFG